MNNPNNDYWAQKLVPFGRGFKLFPAHLAGRGQGREDVSIELSDELLSQDSALHLAALTLVLCRYTANEEVLIASPGDAEQPVFFRCQYRADWSVDLFRQRIATEMETVRGRQTYSYAEVRTRLGMAGPDDTVDLFRVGYAFTANGEPALFDHWPPLLLSVQGGRCARFSFDTARYPSDFVRQFAGHYVRALAYLAGKSNGLLRDLDLLSESEKDVLASAFNRTEQIYPHDKTLHALFEEQAVRTPDALAVVHENVPLTYRELNASANRLARYLRDTLGVRTGEPVGVLTGRSEKMVVALLAILKAGAAYVPINPKHPWETVNYMIENARIRVLLINSDTGASAATFRGELFVLDAELDGLATATANPEIPVAGSDLAYAIYTSGSTGRPKCVAVEHRSIVNTILWRNRWYGIDNRDRNLQLPAFSFDSSVLDIFCFLAAGASLVIPGEELRFDPRYLRNLIETQGVSRFIITSSYYKVLVHELTGVTSLRSITVAGESTTVDLVSCHYANLPGVPLVNEYGPTENAVCSTACVLREGEPSVPIGVPVANVKVFIFDESMRLVPIGVPGEIFLGGCGLARGYLNQPDLTAERFIQSPLPDYYEGRLYRTGDWGCWRSDGMLEFQGRVDRQVKVRGFRIELGEIEKVLLQHPGCDNVLVLCKQHPSGDKYLAAYVASDSVRESRDLSAFAGKYLPYYMVPDAIAIMPALPINLNGKVDLEYLRGLEDFQSTAGAVSEPRTPEELALLELCRTVFRQPRLGVEDNFFAMGANSLAAMELATAVQGRLGIHIEFQDVYTYPAVRDLALRMAVPREHLRMAASSADH